MVIFGSHAFAINVRVQIINVLLCMFVVTVFPFNMTIFHISYRTISNITVIFQMLVFNTLVNVDFRPIIANVIKGLDFVMTAMFVTIFMNQWMKEKKKYTGLIGILATALCLILLGKNHFMIPAMMTIIILLTLFKKPISTAYTESEEISQ